MQMNSGEESSVHLHYSPTFKQSIGWYSRSNWAEDYKYSGVQYNRLMKRWNEKGSQANFYIKSGVGLSSKFDKDVSQVAGLVLAAAGVMQWRGRMRHVPLTQRIRVPVPVFVG